MIKRPENLKCPHNLSVAEIEAHKIIMKFLEEHDLTDTGGCRAFYSPEEWKERGELYGEGAELIVVHDGGDLHYVFNYDYGCYEICNKMVELLISAGFHAEGMYNWCTAIYKS